MRGNRAKAGKKLWPWWAVAGMDILALGVALCVFSLFHHVLPMTGGDAIRHIVQVDQETPAPENSPAPAGTPQPTPGGNAAASPAPTATPYVKTDPGDFSETFPDYDTGEGALHSYQSENIRVAITEHEENGVTYFVADVYVRHIKHLVTAFANGKYGRGQRQDPVDIAVESGAIFAVNGDYYGARNSGIVIRNGDLYRDSISADICVLYGDGRMESYLQKQFDLDAAIQNGAYQAWNFGPKLLENGKAATEFNSSVQSKNPRSAIGYYAPGHYCFVLVDGRQQGYSVGMTMAELAGLFEKLGCVDAYNLDGGQTAMMVFQGEVVNRPANGGRKCSDIVGIAEGGAK